MAATDAQIVKMRRMIAEPTSAIYGDPDLAEYIESYPLADADGNEPDHASWVARYDLNAAAAELWAEKAAAVAQDFTFIADGGVYTRSQVFEQYMKQSRYYAARKAIGSVKVHVEADTSSALPDWVGNAPEVD